jgi:hypothetical protein
MPAVTKSMVYLGKNAEGELENKVIGVGIKLKTLLLGRNKDYIAVEEVEQGDASENNFDIVFSIAKRDVQGFRQALNSERGVLDHADINNSENFEKLLEKLAAKGYVGKEQIPQSINNSDSQPLTTADIGKTVVVVDHSDEAIAKDIKHKFILVWFDEEKGIATEWADNTEVNKGKTRLKGKLIFYVEDGHREYFYNYIKGLVDSYLKHNPDKGSSLNEAELVDFGNEIIKGLMSFTDKNKDKALLLTQYASILLAQYVYAEVKGVIGLSPDTLVEGTENKLKVEDSASLHSKDSGVSSQSEASAEDNAKPLYPNLNNDDGIVKPEVPVDAGQSSIDTEKEEALAVLRKLKLWIANEDGLSEKKANLNIAIDKKIISRLNEGLSYVEGNSNPLGFIANELKSHFDLKVSNLDLLSGSYYEANRKSVKTWIEKNLAEIKQGDQGFKRIKDLVERVKLIDDYIKEYKLSNDAFKTKVEEFFEHQATQRQLISTLIDDQKLEGNKNELQSTMDSWKKELEKFKPINEKGKFESQDALNSQIKNLKTSFDQQYKKLEAANHAVLQERLQQATAKLKDFAESLQVKEGTEIAQEKIQLLNGISTLSANIPTATLDNGKIEDFQIEYTRLSQNLTLLKQGLTRKQFIADQYNDNVVKAVSDIQSKVSKLQKENDNAADTKADKLIEIEGKVWAIKEKIDSSNDVTEIKAAIDSVRTTIQANAAGISDYRSQWGSRYFFTTLGFFRNVVTLGCAPRMNLGDRVESRGLVDELSYQLDNFEQQLEVRPSATQFTTSLSK